MKNRHIIITAYMTVLTTWAMCFGHFKIGLPIMIITFLFSFIGMTASIINLIEILLKKEI